MLTCQQKGQYFSGIHLLAPTQSRFLYWNFSSFPVGTLQNACREVILQYVQRPQVNDLPIPTKIKEYLNYEVS